VNHTRETDDNRDPLRLPLIIVITVTLLAAVGVGIFGLVIAPHRQAQPAPTTSTGLPSPPESTSSTPNGSPTSMSDPETFARWAASALFDWDTATMNPADVTDKLIVVADPSGDETPGLASDIANYLPDQATWATLRGYATRQWLQIDTVVVPDAWGQAKQQAEPGQILPGTVAYTISGTRHREGVWNTQPTSYTAPATFTLFIVCAPSYPDCHLLRLSLPEQPLN